MSTSLLVRDDARLAGEVIRYHTWPHVRQQSVGEHSWQVARIIMAIAPSWMWALLLPHTVVHDLGEIGTGDVPYPVKKDNPELGALFNALEHATLDELCQMWMIPRPVDLPDELKRVFKLAEFIEMWEWGLEELQRGNQFARKVAERCREVIVGQLAVPGELNDAVRVRASAYVKLRGDYWDV